MNDIDKTPAPQQTSNVPAVAGEVTKLEQWATTLALTNRDQRNAAMEIVRKVKSYRQGVVAFFCESKGKARAAWQCLVDQEKSYTDKCDAIESKVKSVVSAWDAEQERLRLAEVRRLQAIADEEARVQREAIARQMAAERAEQQRLAAISAEAARKEQAELAAKQARARSEESKLRLAREAEESRQRAAQEEQQRQAQADAQQQQLAQQQAAVVATVVTVAAPVQQAGEQKRVIWKARVTSSAALPKDYMVPNEKMLDALAKASKGAMKIPGVEFYTESILAVGK